MSPYQELINMGIYAKQPKLLEVLKTWNPETNQCEPTLEQLQEAYNEDAIATLTSVSQEYLGKLIDQGLSEDYDAYWMDAEEEMRCMMQEAAIEFGGRGL